MSKTKKTRKELLDLREHKELAINGKDLLEDRIGALNQRITHQAQRVYTTRIELRDILVDAYRQLGISMAKERRGVTIQSQNPLEELSAMVEVDNVMGVKVSRVEVTTEKSTDQLDDTNTLQELRKKFRLVIETMADLASKEHFLDRISRELRKTRQRFNSLDQRVIPGLEDKIRDIEVFLEEREQEEQFKQREWR